MSGKCLKQKNVKESKDYLSDFKERFQQQAFLNLKRTVLVNDILSIRRECGIPPQGFSGEYKSADYRDYLDWLSTQRVNGYKKVTKIFSKYKTVEAKPKYFLERAAWSYEATSDPCPVSFYFYDNLKTFDKIIKEKPFPGIVNYILFNKVLIPESNELQLSLENCGNEVYTILRIGPNATMNDIRDFFPAIEAFQKKSQRYSKLKNRKSKILQRGESIINHEAMVKEAIARGEIGHNESNKGYVSRKKADLSDSLFKTTSSVDNDGIIYNKKQDERNIKNIRVIKARYKKKTI